MAPFEVTCLVNSFSKQKNAEGVMLNPLLKFNNDPANHFLQVDFTLSAHTRTGVVEGTVGYSITYYPMPTYGVNDFLYFKHAVSTLISECNKILLLEYNGKAFFPIPIDQQLVGWLGTIAKAT